jgi:hypothetical protein
VTTRPLQWIVAGIGDFDRDRKDDIVWRDTVTGANEIWLSADSATPKAVASVPDRAWRITTVGDYNGDGRSDLVWHHDTTNANYVWYSAEATQSKALGVKTAEWIPAR